MDPLSDVLSLLKLNTYWCAGFDFGGDWALGLKPYDGISFYAAVSGECWLAMDGVPQPVHVSAGDCLILPRGRAFRIASDLALAPLDPYVAFTGVKDGGVNYLNEGGDFFCVGGQFALSGDHANVLVGTLPPVMHIHDDQTKAALRWCVELMRRELREPQPGGFLVAQQLAMMILVQALRLHLTEGSTGVGWLFALADKQMAAALDAMHKNPADRWTLQLLAHSAGMSRTTFTLKFKETVGTSPMEYLTRWRMMVGADRLVHSNESISAIALSLGYESESAFSTAFKRVTGTSPRQYGRRWDRSHGRAQTAGIGRLESVAM